jgi:hypothetical protein
VGVGGSAGFGRGVGGRDVGREGLYIGIES